MNANGASVARDALMKELAGGNWSDRPMPAGEAA